MTESLSVLDHIRLNFSSEGLFVLNLTLAFIMFGVALAIKVEHFKNVLQKPKPVVVGFISQFFLLPLVTVILVMVLRNFISPTMAMGMILVAACPGGNISNFITSLAKGNIALSVSLTAIATISAIILTPLNFAVWGGIYTKFISIINSDALLRPLKINPWHMFQTVFILLGIPLVVGMWFNHQFPKITAKIFKPIKIISILLFAGIVVMALMNNFEYFMKYIKYIFIIVLIHNGAALFTGFFFATGMRLSRYDRRAVSIETGIQNSGLALVLLFNPKIFPPELAIGGMAFIAAWWGIWHILSGMGIAAFWSIKPLNR
ncbi:MAG: bile acid:sodium symporter [Bacteroidales bacterium]|nr:bile acid:sodium symporter [Bacteroidales bacterium]